MDDDFFRRDYDQGPQKHDNLFLWTILILLLTGGVLACWLGSFYIFGHPENPRSYHLLVKLHKLDPPKRFEYTAAPPGDFLTPQKLYEKYSTMPDYALSQENETLLRNYIRNYQTSKNPVPYLIGKFTILNSRELTSKDLFNSGMIALAQGAEYPQVLVEYVYTTDPQGIADLKQILAPGLEIKLERTVDLSAIIHIEKLSDGRLMLTAVPLLYGTYTLKQGNGTFSLDPPAGLHLEGGIPIIKASDLPAGKSYASHTPAPADNGDGSQPSPTPSTAEQLVHVMSPTTLPPQKPPGSLTSTPVPTPAMAEATPLPAVTPVPIAVAHVTPAPTTLEGPPTQTPATFAQNITPTPYTSTLAQNLPPAQTPPPPQTPPPAQTPPPPHTPPPAATPVTVAANNPGVQLQPFIEAQATPSITAQPGSWKTYHPGQMPRGRLVKAADTVSMADRGLNGERVYLSGQFIVTASGDNRAVLRAKGGVLSTLNPLDHTGAPRIVVEFPPGYTPPAEGTTVTRDEMRPFEIRDVQRARDGTINVMVREVTTPE